MKYFDRTIGSIFAENKGIGPGFSAMRIVLSLSVLALHCVPLSKGIEYLRFSGSWYEPIVLSRLPIFFALSGFLVMRSASRADSLLNFLAYRGLRLLPALIVTVILSILVVGALFTTLPLGEYLTQWTTWRYLGNAFGFIQFDLPGVFESNPFPRSVNGSLWTLQLELYCYGILTLLFATKLIFSRQIFTALVVSVSIAMTFLNLTTGWSAPGLHMPAPVLIYYFMIGALAYQWHFSMPYSKILFFSCLAMSYLLIPTRNFVFIAAWPLVYIMIFIGSTEIRLPAVLKGRDLSYGIYLFGFPVQQALVASVAALREPVALFFTSAPIAILLSVLSWKYIEKPTMALRRHLKPPRKTSHYASVNSK